MLKALIEMKDTLDFPIDKLVYVMTDFTESNFNFWKGNLVSALDVFWTYFASGPKLDLTHLRKGSVHT